MKTRFSRYAWAVLLLAAISACTPNIPYRTISSPCNHQPNGQIDDACLKHSIHHFKGSLGNVTYRYVLGIVELDDQGQLHDRRQLEQLTETIRKEDNPLVIVYVHGWKNNAAPENRDLRNFQEILQQVAAREAIDVAMASLVGHISDEMVNAIGIGIENDPYVELEKERFKLLGSDLTSKEVQRMISIGKERFPDMRAAVATRSQPREVIGVYVGWRGESITVPGLRQMTFWGRKSVANKIGEGALSAILLKLETITLSKRAEYGYRTNAIFDGLLKTRHDTKSFWSQDVAQVPAQLVIVGHSFGAAAVYAAVSQVLLTRYLESCYAAEQVERKACLAKGVGDLVILINPAFEAIKFDAMHSLVSESSYVRFGEGQAPLLVVLGSEGDWPNKRLFPFGRFASTMFDAEKKSRDQSRKNKTAIGLYRDYQTHCLTETPGKNDFASLHSAWSQLTVEDIKQLQEGLSSITEEQYGQLMDYVLFTLNAEVNLLRVLKGYDTMPTTASDQATAATSPLARGYSVETRAYVDVGGVRFSHGSPAMANNPYLFIQVGKNLVPGHSEIFDPRFLEFIDLVIKESLRHTFVRDYLEEHRSEVYQ